MTLSRPIFASLISAAFSLGCLILFGLWEASRLTQAIEDDRNDAPLRAFGVLIILLPVIFPVLSIAYYATGCTLRRIGLSSFRKFVGASVVLVLILGVVIGIVLGESRRFGIQDLLFSIAAFTLLFSLLVVPGAVLWWFLTKERA
jgi:hypothetical protein